MCISGNGLNTDDPYSKEICNYAKKEVERDRKDEGVVVFLKALMNLLRHKK
ncbi:MAG: hypothetical protein US70_C0015G0006 [Parcubacteria group bacterium GW2011_GWD2_38_11]|nr:MAG: hypothetical protein US70_C0015G0006 [Parcubacteria group bacterium GW2011_GWD2_38_11]